MEGIVMTATILQFPKNRVEYSPDDYRPEPAEVHIAFIGQRSEEVIVREIVAAWMSFWWAGGL
jgi:hypothetical protein